MSSLYTDTIRKTGGSAGVDIRIKNTSVYESDGGTSVTQNIVQGLAKVWVNFDGGASGAAARDSFNVSGMTDHASGSYQITINSDMSNVNYSATDSVGDHDNAGESHAFGYVHTHATGSVGHIVGHFDGSGNADRSNINVQICGDLA